MGRLRWKYRTINSYIPTGITWIAGFCLILRSWLFTLLCVWGMTNHLASTLELNDSGGVANANKSNLDFVDKSNATVKQTCTNYCHNDGLCSAGQDGSLNCACPSGFTGPTCLIPARGAGLPCAENVCRNGGICYVDEENTGHKFDCVCSPEFTGLLCELPLLRKGGGLAGLSMPNQPDQQFGCEPSCPEGSVCDQHQGALICRCIPGSHGVPNCRNNALCVAAGSPNAESHPQELHSLFVISNSEDSDHNDGDAKSQPYFECICPIGFTGLDCGVEVGHRLNGVEGNVPPQLLPVHSGGMSSVVPGITATIPFLESGRAEPIPLNCLVEACHNRGTCLQLTLTGGSEDRCQCPPGWTGRVCNEDLDECNAEINPCGRGLCVNDIGSFSCRCQVGFTGPKCDLAVDECLSEPCLNGGSCIDLAVPGEYYCMCTDAWAGERCEIMGDRRGEDLGNGISVDERGATVVSTYREGSGGGICEGFSCDGGQSCVAADDGRPTCMDTSYPKDSATIGVYPSLTVQRPVLTAPGAPRTDSLMTTGTNSANQRSPCQGIVCYHNGTCLETARGPVCACMPGYSGDKCEDMIAMPDGCRPNPCQNQGECMLEALGKHGELTAHCNCQRGYAGPLCQIPLSESSDGGIPEVNRIPPTSIDPPVCDQSKCQHGGKCFRPDPNISLPSFDKMHCNCFGTGYRGRFCDEEINECIEIGPCSPPGTTQCVNMPPGSYTCLCLPGWGGRNCSEWGAAVPSSLGQPQVSPEFFSFPQTTAIPPSLSRHNGASLFFHPTMEGIESVLPAAATIALAPSKKLASLVSVESTVTDRVVTNSASGVTIEAHGWIPNDDDMATVSGTQSSNIRACSEAEKSACRIAGSTKVRCAMQVENGARDAANSGPSCRCAFGYASEDCSQRTTASFSGESFMVELHQPPLDKYTMSLRFRTTLPNGIIALGTNIFSQQVFVVGLDDRRPIFRIWSNGGLEKRTAMDDAPVVDDGEWWELNFSYLSNNEASMMVYRPSESDVNSEEESRLFSAKIPLTGERSAISSTKFGGGAVGSGQNFIGCLQDVVINETALVPAAISAQSLNIQLDCVREAQCAPASSGQDKCHGHGTCVDLWTRFACLCDRPYYEPDCLSSPIEATFGHEDNQSYVEIQLTDAEKRSFQEAMNVSFLVRTTAPGGILMYLGQRISPGVGGFGLSGMFIAAEVAQGRLRLSTKLGPEVQTWWPDTPENVPLDDGKVHLVAISRDGNAVIAAVDGVVIVRGRLPYKVVYPLAVDVFYLGGVPPASKSFLRSKRQTGGLGVNHQAFLNSNSFKGTIQDIRINGGHVVLFPSNDPALRPDNVIGNAVLENSVLEGTVTDDVCRRGPWCANGGTCRNTFNDYECQCTLEYRGRNCTETNFCAIVQCPEGSECLNTLGGYACLGPTTFPNNSSSSASFSFSTINQSAVVEFRRFAFKFRTRELADSLVYYDSPESYLAFGLRDGFLILAFNIRKSDLQPLSVSEQSLADGDWHSVVLEFSRSDSTINIDSGVALSLGTTVPTVFDAGFWDRGALHVGRVPVETLTEASSIRWTGLGFTNGFKGCLDAMLFGADVESGLNVQFYPPEIFAKDPNMMKLNANALTDIAGGCSGDPVCTAPANPCLNGGNCSDLWNLYTCSCLNGFRGDQCQENIDDCLTHECAEFGTCVDGIANYTCACLAGYTGARCDQDIDECASNPCLYEGTCLDQLAQFRCQCHENYTGDTCQFKINVDCSAGPCINGAECEDVLKPGGEKSFLCSCLGGYEGERCEREIDYCAGGPCLNGATCLSYTDRQKFVCECAFGFKGMDCSENINECEQAVCVHGQCLDLIGNYSCSCDEGWTGTQCGENIDECLGRPCQNGASCVDTPGNFTCKCPEFYLGRYCESPGSCLGNPCVRGQCRQDAPTVHACLCPPAFTGVACENEIDFCEPRPCENNATCQSYSSNATYGCSCVLGFMGHNCETNIDDCAANDCAHHAVCVDEINGYHCDCVHTGFTGEFCTEDVDECALGLCQRGKCQNSQGSFQCRCETDYIGAYCKHKDPCLSNGTHQCGNGAECYNGRVDDQLDIVLYNCSCQEGFEGLFCMEVARADVAIPILYIVTPIVGLIVLLCLIAGIAFVCMARTKRATHGHYSPSRQEQNGARVQLGPMMKPPPEERLI